MEKEKRRSMGNGVWLEKETPHYRLFYRPGSYAEAHIREIARWQEECYARIAGTLGVEMDRKIRMYMCGSREEAAAETGFPPSNGMTLDYDLVYAVVTEEIRCLGPHEDAHLLSFRIAVPESVFLREGIAMFFDGAYNGKDNVLAAKEWAAAHPGDNILRLLDNGRFYELPEEVSYPLSGAFTGWIIRRYGMEKYREFFRSGGDVSVLSGQAAEELSMEFLREMAGTEAV